MNEFRERLLQEFIKLSPLFEKLKVSSFLGGRGKLESMMPEDSEPSWS